MTELGIIILALAVSLAVRVKDKKRAKAHDFPEHAVPSPLSEALQELIGMAGGIYLSLLLLVSFLKIDLPQSIVFMTVEIELLPAVAIVLAIIQPFFLKAGELITKG